MTKIPRFDDSAVIGHLALSYDAWNRLVKIETDDSTPLTIAVMTYDGAGRRTSKVITNSRADWDRTYHFYYDGQSEIETRNGSDEVLKQEVWGTQYVDELIQIAINQDPSNATSGTATENMCERFFWACQDANYNVIGIVSPTGDLIERYEYTPYGQRRVFSRGWLLADINGDGTVDSTDNGIITADWGANPDSPADLSGNGNVGLEDYTIWRNANGDAIADDDLVTIESPHSFQSPLFAGAGISLCDNGHQGLMHDKEFGLIYNRARYLHPVLGRFASRDREGYIDGMSLYEYVRSKPVGHRDPRGTYVEKKEYENYGSAELVYRDESSTVTRAYVKYWGPSKTPDSYEYEIGQRNSGSEILTTDGTYVMGGDVNLWGRGRRHDSAWKDKWRGFVQQYPRQEGISRMHVWIENRSGTEVPFHQGICFGTIQSWKGGGFKDTKCFKYGLKDVLGRGAWKVLPARICDLAEVEEEESSNLSGSVERASAISISWKIGTEIIEKLESMVGKEKYKGPYFLSGGAVARAAGFTKARGLNDKRDQSHANKYDCRDWAADRFKEVKDWVAREKGKVVEFGTP